MGSMQKIGRATLDKMPTPADCREIDSLRKRQRMVEDCAKVALRAYQRTHPGEILPPTAGVVTWDPRDKETADKCPRFVAYFRREVERFCGLTKPAAKPSKRSKPGKSARKGAKRKNARKVKVTVAKRRKGARK